MGAIHLFQGEYEQALASAQKAVELNLNHATNTALLGMIQHNAGRPKEAIPTLKRAMRLSPYHPAWFLMELADAYTKAGRTDNALVAWREFLARSPDPALAAMAHFHIALILEGLGKTDQARDEIARALEFDPSISISGLADQGKHTPSEILRNLGVPE